MGFNGAVISDDLEMAALSYLSPSDRAVQALNAGVDLLLVGYTKRELPACTAASMAQGIIRAVDEGTLSETVLCRAQNRIRNLLSQSRVLRSQSELSNYEESCLGCKAHQELRKSVSDE